jgi:hypothetical protein
MLAFDSNLAPIVGQQITLSGKNHFEALPRLKLFMDRAAQGECDLVAKSMDGGYLYQPGGMFRPDKRSAPLVSETQLINMASRDAGETTFTCVPPGSGVRIGIDRDEDGVLDGDEH